MKSGSEPLYNNYSVEGVIWLGKFIYLLIYLFYPSKNILIVHFLKASYRSWSIQAVNAAI